MSYKVLKLVFVPFQVCSLPCHKPYKCFPRCDIACCSPPLPPSPPRPIIPPTCPGACPAKCFPTCSQACCAPSPPSPPKTAPYYYPMPPAAQPVTSRCPGSCPAICAPLCSVRCCIARSVAQQNAIRPLTYSAPQVAAQASMRYPNYYPSAQNNNYNNYYRQNAQYARARSQYQNPYARYQIYGRPSNRYWSNYQNLKGYRYQG